MVISLFLGAGMSAAYGMPTAEQFKDRIISKYPQRRAWRRILMDPKLPDIEHVWDAVASFNGLAASPQGRHWVDQLCACYRTTPREMALLQGALESEVFEACRWDPSKDRLLGGVLDPFLSLAAGQVGGIPVFTTNYDRSVEEHCAHASSGYRCYDGFAYDPQAGRTLWAGVGGRAGLYGGRAGGIPQETVNLLKIHGSLGWKMSRHGLERTAQEAKAADPNYRDFVIYPSAHAKPYDGIHAEIFGGFAGGLCASDACVAVGYSFRDRPIAEQFGRFVWEGKTLVAVGPEATSSLGNVLAHVPYAAGPAEWMQVGASHYVLAGRGPARVHAIQEAIGEGTVYGTVEAVRNAIAMQYGQARVRMAGRGGAWTPRSDFAAPRGRRGRPARVRQR